MNNENYKELLKMIFRSGKNYYQYDELKYIIDKHDDMLIKLQKDYQDIFKECTYCHKKLSKHDKVMCPHCYCKLAIVCSCADYVETKEFKESLINKEVLEKFCNENCIALKHPNCRSVEIEVPIRIKRTKKTKIVNIIKTIFGLGGK